MCCVKTGREGAESLCLYYDDMRQKIFVELDKLGLDGRTNIVTPSAPDGAKKNVLREKWEEAAMSLGVDGVIFVCHLCNGKIHHKTRDSRK